MLTRRCLDKHRLYALNVAGALSLYYYTIILCTKCVLYLTVLNHFCILKWLSTSISTGSIAGA